MSAISCMVLFSNNVSVLLLSTSTVLREHGASSSKKSPAWNLTNHFDTFDLSQHLPHTLHKSFSCVFQLYFYLSWNHKAQYTKSVAYFLPFSILKWSQKFHQFWHFFSKCTLIWQYNLTKLFQMKLKTTRCYKSHLMGEKKKMANPVQTQFYGMEKTMETWMSHAEDSRGSTK